MAVATAGVSATLSLLAFGGEKAQAAPDPQSVQRYLARIDAEQTQAADENLRKKAGRGESIRKVVEGAAVRAPTGSVINGIEAALAEKLG